MLYLQYVACREQGIHYATILEPEANSLLNKNTPNVISYSYVEHSDQVGPHLPWVGDEGWYHFSCSVKQMNKPCV